MKYYLIKVNDTNPQNGVYGNEQTGFHIVEKEEGRFELTKKDLTDISYGLIPKGLHKFIMEELNE